MDNTKKSELERIKKEYLLTEQRWQDEKACLSNIIYVLGRVVAMHEALMAEYEPLKKMVASEKELPLDDIKEQKTLMRKKSWTS
jgi:translation initiation factor 2 gamma subunit (eIF-2gamma)